jgi:Selenocysteine lyase
LLDSARARLAAYVGADPDNLAFTPNASTALNAAIRSLPLGPGDELLLGDDEYGGMEILCEFVARRTGATLVRRPFAQLDPGPRTRAVFCSHVEWVSGRVNELAPLLAAARDVGACRSSTARTRRARSRCAGRARARRVLGQLPQVAVRAEGLGLSLCAPGGAAVDRPARRLVGLRRRQRVPPAAPLAGNARPLGIPGSAGGDRLPG